MVCAFKVALLYQKCIGSSVFFKSEYRSFSDFFYFSTNFLHYYPDSSSSFSLTTVRNYYDFSFL